MLARVAACRDDHMRIAAGQVELHVIRNSVTIERFAYSDELVPVCVEQPVSGRPMLPLTF